MYEQPVAGEHSRVERRSRSCRSSKSLTISPRCKCTSSTLFMHHVVGAVPRPLVGGMCMRLLAAYPWCIAPRPWIRRLDRGPTTQQSIAFRRQAAAVHRIAMRGSTSTAGYFINESTSPVELRDVIRRLLPRCTTPKVLKSKAEVTFLAHSHLSYSSSGLTA